MDSATTAIPIAWQQAAISVQFILAFLQLGVLAAAIWLALETRGLRDRTGKQVQLLQSQISGSDKPAIVVDNISATTDGPPSVHLVSLGKGHAFRIGCYWYDSKNKNIAIPTFTLSNLKVDGDAWFSLYNASRKTFDDAVADMVATYQIEAGSISGTLKHSDKDSLLVCYRGIQGDVYGIFIKDFEKAADGNYESLPYESRLTLKQPFGI